MSGEIIRFPIGRVVREHRIPLPLPGTRESEAIDVALRSVDRAIKSMERQRSSLLLRYRRALEKETLRQTAKATEKNMARIYARDAEDRAAELAAINVYCAPEGEGGGDAA